MSMQVVAQRRFNSMERKPRMLKEFLNENSNSCSSGGFKSLPRKPNNSIIEKMELKSYSSSKSTFQTLVNTIRSISFFTKSLSMISLPRSLSRKLSSKRRRRRRRNQASSCNEIKISTVRIKDILRWKSFRDMVVENHHHPSLPSPSEFHRYTTESTTTNTTTSVTCSSNSSFCGSSFSSDGDFFTSWEAQNDVVEAGQKFSFSPLVVGKDSVASQEVLTCQEDEQHSPVSVLQIGEDEFSPFDQSLGNIERRKQKFIQTVQKFGSLAKFDLANLDQCLSLDDNSGYDEEYEDSEEEKIEQEDWIEEKAKQLLHCVKAKGSSVQSCEDYLDIVLLDFFKEELTGSRNQNRNDKEFQLEILRIAEDWINGSFAFDVGHVNKDAYIKDMDRRGQWTKFEEGKEELALEIEIAIWHSLVVDLLDLDG